MLTLNNSPITEEEFNALIDTVAMKPEFSDCLGVEGCDLSKNHWWACYVRQRLEAQTKNNRLPDYLLTCAKEARALGVVVPREYVFYDAVSGEHLERPGMIRLRKELVPQRRIAGVIFPALDRLSRDPLHRGIFEYEVEYVGVAYHYADAPNGSDPMSKMVRDAISYAAKYVRLANKNNNRGGNIGRVLKGWVPAGKPAYGYRYRKEVDQETGAIVRAWWDVNELDPDGNILYGSEAWVVSQIFRWIGIENRSTYWVAKKLNELGIKPRHAKDWSPSQIVFMVRRQCYTGKHAYNTAHYVPNPKRPLKDITGEIKRTIRESKPEEEHIKFNVPILVTNAIWEKANKNLDERKGNRPRRQTIEVLFRGRVFCPKCGRSMTVRKDPKCPSLIYYICPGLQMGWKASPCDMRWVRADLVDPPVWRRIKRALYHPDLVLKQMERSSCANQVSEIEKNIRLSEYQIRQAESGIAQIQQAYENKSKLYTGDEAERKIAEYRAKIARAIQRKGDLEKSLERITSDRQSFEQVREALTKIHLENIRNATFEEKARVIDILDVKVYPSEGLDHVAVTCAVNLAGLEETGEESSCYKISMASPKL